MIEQDTVKLLRECDAGAKMGTASISDVLDNVENDRFKQLLEECKEEHNTLQHEIQGLLDKYHDDGKQPNPMAQSMSWIKTNMKLMMKPTDQTVAGLITDGCHMGIKSLHRYLNEYSAADTKSRALAEDVIAAESDLCTAMEPYL